MLKKSTLTASLAVLIVISFTISCVKDNFKFDKLSDKIVWRPNMAAPIAFAKLNLQDLLQDYDSAELVIKDETGLLYIVYESRVVSIIAEDLIQIPNQDLENTFVVPDLNSVPGGYYAIRNTEKTLTLNHGERFDSLIMDFCNLNVVIRSTFLHTGLVKLTFPGVSKNGQDLVINTTINSASGTFLSNQNHPLNGYTMDLSDDGNGHNKLPVKMELFLDNATSVNPGEYTYVYIDFNNIDFQAAFGYAGQRDLSIGYDSVNLEMYTNAFQGQAYFEDPRINATIYNSYGLPIQFKLDNLAAYSNVYGSNYSISLPSYYNPLIIDAPTISQMGETVKTEIKLNKTNCNITDVISYLPKYIYYSVEASTNPDSTINNNFVLDTSKFEVDVEVELPLWGHAQFFAVQDTTEFDFSELYDDIEEVDWALLRLNITNGFPVEIGFQVYFADSNYHVIDSLFIKETQLLVSGVLDSEGRVVEPTLKTTDMTLTREQVKKMKPVKWAFFRGTASTTNNAQEVVKIYQDYGIEVQVAAQIQATINSQKF